MLATELRKLFDDEQATKEAAEMVNYLLQQSPVPVCRASRRTMALNILTTFRNAHGAPDGSIWIRQPDGEFWNLDAVYPNEAASH